MRTRSYFIPSVGSLLQTLCHSRHPLAPRPSIEIANKSIKVVKSYVGRRLTKNTVVFWYTCRIVVSTCAYLSTCHSTIAAQLAFIQRYNAVAAVGSWLLAVVVPILSSAHTYVHEFEYYKFAHIMGTINIRDQHIGATSRCAHHVLAHPVRRPTTSTAGTNTPTVTRLPFKLHTDFQLYLL